MTIKFVSAVAVGAVVSLSLASAASAQSNTLSLTASVPGVCLVSSSAVLVNSAVGKAVSARLKQLEAQVTAELTPEKTALETEQKAIQTAAQAATTPAAQQPLQQRADAFSLRLQNFQNKANQRANELRATEQKALGRISTEAQPAVRQVAMQKGCAIVLDTQAVVDANPAMDITAGTIAALDGKITTLTFERERLDAQTGAAPASR